jgi:membrane protease YdiL (CAAX protease family)
VGGFGFGHLYQGRAGIVLTAAIGALLYWVVAATGSLFPAMALHALIDLRFCALYFVLAPPALTS